MNIFILICIMTFTAFNIIDLIYNIIRDYRLRKNNRVYKKEYESPICIGSVNVKNTWRDVDLSESSEIVVNTVNYLVDNMYNFNVFETISHMDLYYLHLICELYGYHGSNDAPGLVLRVSNIVYLLHMARRTDCV